jgi:hypothetical protein
MFQEDFTRFAHLFLHYVHFILIKAAGIIRLFSEDSFLIVAMNPANVKQTAIRGNLPQREVEEGLHLWRSKKPS